MMNNQINEQINEQIIDNTDKDYLFYKSLIPELTVETFIQNELYIKEMFEYDPCVHEDSYDYYY